jgi:cytochrome P450
MNATIPSGFETATEGAIRITKMDDAMEIFMSKRYQQALHQSTADWPVTAQTVSSLHGETHFARRRTENPLFRQQRLREWELLRLDPTLTDHLHAIATTQRREDGLVSGDLLRIVRRSNLAVTAALVGIDGVLDDRTLDRFTEWAIAFSPAAALWFKQGSTKEITEIALGAKELFRIEMFEPAWQRRRALAEDVRQGGTREDDLPDDLLMRLAVDMPDLEDELVLQEAVMFVIAATDTTTMGVATGLQHLLAWLEDHPDDREHVGDLQFLQAVAFEAVRLHPPAFALRKALEDDVLGSGIEVRAGDLIVIDTQAVNQDQEIFGADAAEFNPHREIPKGLRSYGVRPYGVGFGAGAHICIGRPMAVSQSSLSTEATPADAVGTVVRVLLRLLEAGATLDPDDPPVFRTGWLRERYDRFPVLFTRL